MGCNLKCLNPRINKVVPVTSALGIEVQPVSTSAIKRPGATNQPTLNAGGGGVGESFCQIVLRIRYLFASRNHESEAERKARGKKLEEDDFLGEWETSKKVKTKTTVTGGKPIGGRRVPSDGALTAGDGSLVIP